MRLVLNQYWQIVSVLADDVYGVVSKHRLLSKVKHFSKLFYFIIRTSYVKLSRIFCYTFFGSTLCL